MHLVHLRAVPLCFALCLLACSSSEENNNAANAGQGRAPGGSGGSGDSAGGAAGNGSPGPLLDGSTGEGGQSDACAVLEVEAKRPAVDVIFVIDSSSSMVDEIAQVRQNINDFAQSIANAGLDYRVVMIAERGEEDTEMCVPEPLAGPDCASNHPGFHHADVKVSSKEHLYRILTSYDDNDPEVAWKDFVRFDSIKTFITISDDNSYLEAEDFEQDLFQLEPAGMFGSPQSRRYILHAICGWQQGTPLLDSSNCGTAVNNGEDFQILSMLTGGIVDSVCKQDYSGVLQNIADGVVQSVGCQFKLPQANGGTLDHNNVIVNYFASGSGAAEPLDRVTDESKCAQWSEGWYYDDNDDPTTIDLCPDACAKVEADAEAAIQILVGCVPVAPK